MLTGLILNFSQTRVSRLVATSESHNGTQVNGIFPLIPDPDPYISGYVAISPHAVAAVLPALTVTVVHDNKAERITRWFPVVV